MLDDDLCRESLSAVTHCSVLKGVTRRMERKNVEASLVTFNSFTDARAPCGRKGQVSRAQEDMARSGVPPNLITYSSRIKGYRQMGDTQTAFDLGGT